MEGFDGVESFLRKKSLNTCILSCVMETFMMIDSLEQHTMQMFYSWVISAKTLWVPISFSSAEYAMISIFLLNLSLYRQHYFWDVDACCRPRTQLFVKFNDSWQQLNSHELVAKISKAPTDYARKCYLWHTWPNCDPVMSLIFLLWQGWWWKRHWK